MSALKSDSIEAVNSLPNEPAALGYSGGIDSSILANLLTKSNENITLVALGREKYSDIESVSNNTFQGGAKYSSVVGKLERNEIEAAAKKVSAIVSPFSLSHFEDCTAFWLIAKKTSEFPKIDYIISANGPDELFCGYDRFRRILNSGDYENIRNEILVALRVAEKLGSQVNKIMSEFGYQIREPLLNKKFRDSALRIPVEYKILPINDLLRKRIWRCFGRFIGLQDDVVKRPKKAMQFGMGIHGIIHNMLKHGSLKLDIPKRNLDAEIQQL